MILAPWEQTDRSKILYLHACGMSIDQIGARLRLPYREIEDVIGKARPEVAAVWDEVDRCHAEESRVLARLR